MLFISPKPKLTVLSHFYNEEWLLPDWIKHHSKLFDHGILVNYGSTDRSVEIIKNLAPTWKIVDSRNTTFDAELCDFEMMEYERTVSGWKMVLNITEFLFTNNLREKIEQLEENKISIVRSIGYQINDTREEKENHTYDSQKPLILQKFNGSLDKWRFRILHKKNDGAYHVGRHFDTPGLKVNPYTNRFNPEIPIADNNLFTFWYRFAPFWEQLPRKIQISSRIPESDKKKGYGWNHWDLNEKKLTERWEKELKNCSNLMNIAGIQQEYEKIKKMYR